MTKACSGQKDLCHRKLLPRLTPIHKPLTKGNSSTKCEKANLGASRLSNGPDHYERIRLWPTVDGIRLHQNFNVAGASIDIQINGFDLTTHQCLENK